ncbi:MAG TPA: PAS domain-containing protein, partial [Gammaproteobacteria bacterium]|nr:PAS domain-containing protein [Gammaproteobacteria bacterium]
VVNDHIEWQGHYTKMLGFSLEELGHTTKDWIALIHPEDRDSVQAQFDNPQEGKFFDSEYRVLKKDGEYTWVWDHGVIDFDAQGETLSVTGLMRDISERKAAEKALKEHQARIEHLLDANPIILYSTRVINGKFSPYWVGKSIERILGYTVEEASQPGWWAEHIHPEDRKNCLERIKNLQEQDNLELEYRFIHKDGHTLWIRDGLRILHDQKGTPTEIIGIWNDITEYVETETKLRQIQKLDAIGQLTSGVAHDFNNRLTVILGNLQLLERQLGDNKELKNLVHSAIEAAKAGATLTQRLLSFSRQQVLETEVVNVNDLVVESNQLFDNILGEIVNVELRLQDDLWSVYIDPNQMQEALLNLCVNAKEAMPKGGNLIIETSNVNFDYDLNKNHYRVMAGDYIKISVTDTGCGMSRETLDRAFEPFFTTKTRGSGTGIGLGLAMVYGFVKQSMGYINIYSESGRGTCVNIYLPKYSRRDTQPANATQAAKAGNSEHVSHFNNITVLVVEDDTFVRNVSTMLLKELGCKVIEAENAREGLSILGNNKDVDIVFSDMMMPGGMNGIEMINEMRLDKPDLRAIIVSGYSEDTVVSNDMKILWLKKPFTRESLVNKLNEALENRSPS